VERSDLGTEGDRALMDALFAPAGRQDPFSAFAEHETPGCRYQVVEQVLRDRRTGAAAMPSSDAPLFQLLARFMARLDGERHHAVRSRFARVFTPRRAVAYAALIEARANRLLDDLEARAEQEPVDLVAGFARPLPFGVIADVIGVPKADQQWLEYAVDEVMASFANQRDPAAVEHGNTVVEEVLAYFDALLDERTATPADDLLSVLGGEPVDHDARPDLLANCMFFLVAGHATTTTLLAAGAALLAAHPEQLAMLQHTPTAWEPAVEELLRYLSPITITGIGIREDVTVGDITFKAGPNRLLAYAAANRDPAAFDEPNRFDISRTPTPHLAFAVGAHHCLGAPLARLHGSIGLRTLFTRAPGLRVVDGPTWRNAAPVRQLEPLLVRWL
jgi:pimeloyl-[acyl-carrier protein] synthase